MEKGELDLATSELERSQAIRRGQLRADHPMVVQSLGNLAALYATKNEFTQAERLLREAVALGPGAYGPESVAHAVNLNTLGGVLFRMNRFAEAEPVYREASQIRLKRLGAAHPQTRSTNISLGRTLLRIGEAGVAEGEKLLTDGLRSAMSPDGHLEPRMRDAVMDLARHLQANGREEEAERWITSISSP
jgi:tetratricopeptide (TPR) repeat protein